MLTIINCLASLSFWYLKSLNPYNKKTKPINPIGKAAYSDSFRLPVYGVNGKKHTNTVQVLSLIHI